MRRDAGLLILGALAGAALFAAVLQWLSWHWLSQSGRYVEGLAETGWISDERAWRAHAAQLRERESIMFSGAIVAWQLGEMHRWRAAGMRLWPQRREAELATARQLYFDALAQSPHDGVLMARLAHRLAAIDDPRAIPLMRRALAIAPFEPLAQYHVAGVAMQYWGRLSPETRREAGQMLADALDNYRLAPDVKRLARQHEFVSVLDSLEASGR